MKRNRLTLLFAIALAIAGSGQALAAGGMGGGMGGGTSGGSRPGIGGVPGIIGSDVPPAKSYGFNQNNVVGWQLMSPEERTAHGSKMLSLKTFDECNAYQKEHHNQMEARAKERGVTLSEVNNNACDRMKAKGYFK